LAHASALLGPEKLDSPFGLGKVAPGGFPDVTYAQIIHGILLAATCKSRIGKLLASSGEGCEDYRKSWRANLEAGFSYEY